MARRTVTFSFFAALLALIIGLWAPMALAHHNDDHTQGGGSASSGSDHDGDAGNEEQQFTEDDDANDGDTPNNVSDDDDNAHPSGNDRSVENDSGNQGNSESNPDDSKGPMRFEGELGDDKPNGPGGTDLADQDGNNGCGNDDDFDDDNNGWCGKPTETEVQGSEVEKPCDADATMAGVQKCEEIKGSSTTTPPTKPCDADATMPGVQPCGGDIVLGDSITDRPCPQSGFMGGVIGAFCGGVDVGADEVTQPATDEDTVLGTRFSAAVQPAALQPAAVQAAAVQAAAVTAPAPEAVGAVLPFTGSAKLVPFVAVALLLIGAGALGLRARRIEG